MGSHSVTFHPSQVNIPHLNSSQRAGTHLSYPRVMEGWVDLGDRLHTETAHSQMVTHLSTTPAGSRTRNSGALSTASATPNCTVVFFQYFVSHSGPIYRLQEESKRLLRTARQAATFSYWDIVPSFYVLCLNKYSKILNSCLTSSCIIIIIIIIRQFVKHRNMSVDTTRGP